MNTLAVERATLGQHREALAALRESIAHSTGAGDSVSNCTAMGNASLVFALAGFDDAAAACVGSGRTGFLARSNYNADFNTDADEVFPALEHRLGPQHWGEATARGAQMEYDELLELVVATLDDALTA